MSDNRDFLVTWRVARQRKDRKRVLEWVRDEWALYADKRNAPNLQRVEELLKVEGPTGWWLQVAGQYLRRAEKLGLETPEGRRQVMKFVATAVDLGACMVRVYGDPPEPGEPS